MLLIPTCWKRERCERGWRTESSMRQRRSQKSTTRRSPKQVFPNQQRLLFRPSWNTVRILWTRYLSQSRPHIAFFVGANMSKARRKATPVIPTSCVFEIPAPYQKTLTQEQFLLMDFYLKRGKDRVVVFATVKQLQLLFNSDTVFMDGTFSATPAGFEQIFLIHVQHFGQGQWLPWRTLTWSLPYW